MIKLLSRSSTLHIWTSSTISISPQVQYLLGNSAARVSRDGVSDPVLTTIIRKKRLEKKVAEINDLGTNGQLYNVCWNQVFLLSGFRATQRKL